MEKILDIAIDIETLSRKPTAAIIAIAARPFYIDGWGEAGPSDEPCYKKIDATSCAMYGMDFDKGTVLFWSQQSKEAKNEFIYGWGLSIKDALTGLRDSIKKWKSDHQADTIRVWMQGTDFDGAILRNAYMVVFNDDQSVGENESIPWRHDQLRDSRTFILEHMRRFHPNEEPYSPIPKLEGLTKHVAEDDVRQLIHNVQFCYHEESLADNQLLSLTKKEEENAQDHLEETDDEEDNVQ